MQSSSNQQNDIIDHVAVGDEIQKSRQRFNGMISQVLEFDDQFFAQLIINDGHRQRRWLIGQKLTVIGSLQMQF